MDTEDFRYQGDKRLVEEICDILGEYEKAVTFYGARFDIPFVRTKALEYRIDFPSKRQLIHQDLWFAARSQLKLHSNRLIAVCDILGIPGKGSVEPTLWRKAKYGNQDALRAIQKHNISDVEVLEKVHNRLMPHIGFTRRSI